MSHLGPEAPTPFMYKGPEQKQHRVRNRWKRVLGTDFRSAPQQHRGINQPINDTNEECKTWQDTADTAWFAASQKKNQRPPQSQKHTYHTFIKAIRMQQANETSHTPTPILKPTTGNPPVIEYPGTDKTRTVILPARPEPIKLSPSQMAVVVVDMQNAYCSKGGYVDLAGLNTGDAAKKSRDTISNIHRTLDAARAAGVQVVYLQNGWGTTASATDHYHAEAGGPGSPNYYKSNALRTMRARPELAGQLLARGTWDHAVVDELTPQAQEGKGPADMVVTKTRYSGFFNNVLDSVLQSRGVRSLVFVGVATNVCVESSLRDAFHLEYFCVLLEDAVQHIGPDFVREATVFNVERFFGWVASVDQFCGALSYMQVICS